MKLLAPALSTLLLSILLIPIQSNAMAEPPSNFTLITKSIEQGKQYENAIAALTQSVTNSPQDLHLHLALACAYTGRAASIYRALYFRLGGGTGDPNGIDQYIFSTLDLTTDGKQTGADMQSFAIVPPPAIMLKDDDTAFTLTDDEAVSEIVKLRSNSEDQWTAAFALAKSPEQKANVCYYHAWAMRVFSLMRPPNGLINTTLDSGLRAHLKAFPARGLAFSFASEAIKLDPNNAVFWQTGGDIIGTSQNDAAIQTPYAVDGSIVQDTPTLYRQSLKLNPDNQALWLRLAVVDNGNAAACEIDCQNAVNSTPKNSLVDFFLALKLLQNSTYRRNSLNGEDDAAMTQQISPNDKIAAAQVEKLISQAKTAIAYTLETYPHSPPPMLRSALDNVQLPGSVVGTAGYVNLKEFARDYCGIAIVASKSGDYQGANKLLTDAMDALSPICSDGALKVGSPDILIEAKAIQALQATSILAKERSTLCDGHLSEAETATINTARDAIDTHETSVLNNIDPRLVNSTVMWYALY